MSALKLVAPQPDHGHTSKRFKKCQRCQRRKRLEAFHRNRCNPDGRQAWCKLCQNAWMEDYYYLRSTLGVFEPRADRKSKDPIEVFYRGLRSWRKSLGISKD